MEQILARERILKRVLAVITIPAYWIVDAYMYFSYGPVNAFNKPREHVEDKEW